ncbi:MAG: hypothetical protein KGH60_02205 [Candidatus Micrarchaeota archaeon]|nr:hypothetical protein [Candidatus Micrarchaeota archaeon]
MAGTNKVIGNEPSLRGITFHDAASADEKSGVLHERILEKVKVVGDSKNISEIMPRLEQIIEDVSNSYLLVRPERAKILPDDSIYILESVATVKLTVSKEVFRTAVDQGLVAPFYKFARSDDREGSQQQIYG